MRLVVIGGSAAGMSAAARARRVSPDTEIAVFEKGPYVSTSLCGLPFYISGDVKSWRDLIVYTPEYFREKRNIQVFTEHRVKRILPYKKKIIVEDRNGVEEEIAYDRLVIATGGEPERHFDGENVFYLRRIEDGIRIREFIEKRGPRRAVVVGGGYTGLEVVDALYRRGMKVEVVEMEEVLLPAFDPEIGEDVRRMLENKGIDVILGKRITSLPEGDMVIFTTGISPRNKLAQDAGIETGKSGGIKVDERLQTSHFGIYACGDCAEFRDWVSGKRRIFPLGTVANKTGRACGENAAGGNVKIRGIVWVSVFRVLDMEIGKAGLSLKEAREFGMDAESVMIEGKNLAHFMPDAGKVKVKLVYERRTGRILGGEVWGEGVQRRVDILATAIKTKMNMDELAMLDLSYSPPFSPVWDPVVIAARKGGKK